MPTDIDARISKGHGVSTQIMHVLHHLDLDPDTHLVAPLVVSALSALAQGKKEKEFTHLATSIYQAVREQVET